MHNTPESCGPTRQSKLSAFIESLLNLKRRVNKLELLLNDISGTGPPVPSDEDAKALKEESDSLSSFLSNGPDVIRRQTDRLQAIEEGLREGLF